MSLIKRIMGSFCVCVLAFSNTTIASEIKGEELFQLGGFPVTNSMLTTWIFAAVIIIFFKFVLLKGGAKLIPTKGQLAIEAMIDSLGGIFEPLMGKHAYRASLPLLLGFFSYILIMNWSGLLPTVGSVGFETETTEGAKHFVPFLRPANTDLNTTLALSIISFVAWIILVLKYAGAKHFLQDTFGNKADPAETPKMIYFPLFAVFFGVGCIDVISIIMRLLSLSFRLYGNNFGGEVLLENMHELSFSMPAIISWIVPLPFYLLELLIGFIQAFLFTLLTAVYIGLLTNHEEEKTKQTGE